MKIINFDFSNIETNNVEYNPSLLLELIKNKDILCVYKGLYGIGVGYRHIHDSTSNYDYLEFIDGINFINDTCNLIVADVDEYRAIFNTLKK